MVNKIKVDLDEKSYNIVIEPNIIKEDIYSLNSLLLDKKSLVVSDSNVAPLYFDQVVKLAKSANCQVSLTTFQAGEGSKHLETMATIYHDAVKSGLNRSSYIIALGGGVAGDMAGFAAATYMRGIGFIQIPTSLLAMVDSSVGGKTGIDLPEGKNLVGAFWQPSIVIIDPTFLKTLPKREVCCGLAEIVKYAVIMDSDFFDVLECNIDKLNNLDMELYPSIIKRCCQLKAEVVAEDELEHGRRAILNYGHTFGHAIESEAEYSDIQHGEAISIGMCIAGDLAVNLGIWNKVEAIRQEKLLQAIGLPCYYKDFNPEKLFQNMSADKKKIDSKTKLILPNKIGGVLIIDSVSEKDIINAIAGRKK